MSERQLSRERGQALLLLAAELAAVSEPGGTPPPIPAVERYLRRDALMRRLAQAVATHRLVGVTGSRRVGKTALVAMLAQALGPETVWWYRIRPGVNDTLQALLIELGNLVARDGRPELRDYVWGTPPPTLDVGRATRLALDGLSGRRRLLVLDDFGGALGLSSIATFLEEALERLPLVSLVTIGRPLPDAASVEVPPFDQSEVAELLGGVPQGKDVGRQLHELTGGHPATVDAVAAWWRGAPQAPRRLQREVRARGVLATLRAVIAYADGRAA
ncbi:MAG: ATP-binding protein [Actinomycetota bacterium]|nr:ATP-binding protein [Actinomycetota bacterium]